MAVAFTSHDEALRFGGRDGVSSLHLIESAIARPYSGYYPSLARKAAALLHSMANNHGFTDGNKRTAWILFEILVSRSGYVLDIADDAPIDDFVVAVVEGTLDFGEITEWFKLRLLRDL